MTKIKTKVVLALVLLAFLVSACSGCPGKNKHWRNLAIGFKVLSSSRILGEKFDRSLSIALKDKKTKCLKGLGDLKRVPKDDADKAKLVTEKKSFGSCITPILKVSRAWTGEKRGKKGPGVLPMLQTAQRSTHEGLVTAVNYLDTMKSDAECDKDPECTKKVGAWQVILKGALCTAIPVIDAGLKLGVPKFADETLYKVAKSFVEGFACKKGGK